MDKPKTNDELIRWLREHSSGDYRPSADVADRLEAALMLLRQIIRKLPTRRDWLDPQDELDAKQLVEWFSQPVDRQVEDHATALDQKVLDKILALIGEHKLVYDSPRLVGARSIIELNKPTNDYLFMCLFPSLLGPMGHYSPQIRIGNRWYDLTTPQGSALKDAIVAQFKTSDTWAIQQIMEM